MKNTHGYTLIVKNRRGTLFSSVDTRMEARRTNIRKEKRKKKNNKTHGNFYTWHKSFLLIAARFSLFLYKIVFLFSYFQQRRETISTNKVYTSVLRSLEDRSEIDTHTHTHTYTHARIYAQTHTPTLFKNCAEK